MTVTTKKKGRGSPKGGHISLGDYGADLIRIMYRLRGGTARELSEELARVLTAAQEEGDFTVAEEGRDYFEQYETGKLKIFNRVYETLKLMKTQKLVESVSLPRRRVAGKRQGRPELWYQLSETKGALEGGRRCGVGGSKRQVIAAYGRHGSRAISPEARREGSDLKITHCRVRNVVFRTLVDQAAASCGRVRIDPRDLWAESHPSFPVYSGRILDEAGVPVVGPGQRKYEQVEPDGLLPIKFADGTFCTYWLEQEIRVRTSATARKIDRVAAATLREHEKFGAGSLAHEIAEMEDRLAHLKAEQEIAEATGEALDFYEESRERRERIAELQSALKKVSKRKQKKVESFLGFPEAIHPTLFILPDTERAWRLADRLREGAVEMPRLKKLQHLWLGEVDFGRFVLFTGIDSIRSGAALSDRPGAAWLDLSGRETSLLQVAEQLRVLRTRSNRKEA